MITRYKNKKRLIEALKKIQKCNSIEEIKEVLSIKKNIWITGEYFNIDFYKLIIPHILNNIDKLDLTKNSRNDISCFNVKYDYEDCLKLNYFENKTSYHPLFQYKIGDYNIDSKLGIDTYEDFLKYINIDKFEEIKKSKKLVNGDKLHICYGFLIQFYNSDTWLDKLKEKWFIYKFNTDYKKEMKCRYLNKEE